jgi:hypothetical protein
VEIIPAFKSTNLIKKGGYSHGIFIDRWEKSGGGIYSNHFTGSTKTGNSYPHLVS